MSQRKSPFGTNNNIKQFPSMGTFYSLSDDNGRRNPTGKREDEIEKRGKDLGGSMSGSSSLPISGVGHLRDPPTAKVGGRRCLRWQKLVVGQKGEPPNKK